MNDYSDSPETQRPVIVVAIVLAAVLAGALWYFFIFRNQNPEVAFSPSPTTTSSESPITAATQDPAATWSAPTTAPAEPTTAGVAVISPAVSPANEQIPVATTTPTGPGSFAAIGALLSTLGGWLGLRKINRR